MDHWRMGHRQDGRIYYLKTHFKSAEEAKQYYKDQYKSEFDAQTYESGNFFFLEKKKISLKGIFLSLATRVIPSP